MMKINNMLRRIMNTSRSAQQAGFTLIETIVVMGLLSIFLITLTDIFVSITSLESESQATASVSQDGRFLLGRIGYDVHQATAIPMTTGEPNGTLSLTMDGELYEYQVVAGNLQLTTPLGSHRLNSSETTISDFSATKLGSPASSETVQISYTLTSRAIDNQGPTIESFSTTIGVR